RRACSVEASKGGRSFLALLAGEMQGRLAAAAIVATPLGYQRVTLSGEGEFAVHATATVDEALDLASFDFVTVAAMRRQLVDAAHDQLPFLAVGLNARAEQLVGDHVSDFVGHRLAQEVFMVGPVQGQVEAQLVFRQVRDARLLPTQLEADLGAGEALLEEGFRLLVAGFYAGVNLFGHGWRRYGLRADYAASSPSAQVSLVPWRLHAFLLRAAALILLHRSLIVRLKGVGPEQDHADQYGDHHQQTNADHR